MKYLYFITLLVSFNSLFAQISFQENIIDDSLNNPKHVFSADLDDDGDNDVMIASSSNNKIIWYENLDGQGTFGPEIIISTAVDTPQFVYAADFDGDNDLDIISASQGDDKVAWYENTDGLGNFGPQNIISDDANSPKAVYAEDIDGDGDMDVLSASFNDDKIAWYENTDGLGNFGFQQIITSSANGAQSVYATDIDGDGDMDVLSASFNDYKIAWYENTNGQGDFGDEQVIKVNPTDFKTSVYAADIDGDGDMDVLSSSWQGSTKIAWYENTTGLGIFTEHLITNSIFNPTIVFASDVDNDGDIDVLTSSQTDDTIAWFENTDGVGLFGDKQVITDTAEGAQAVFAIDIDGDGDNDVLSASFQDNTVAWYENVAILNNEIFGAVKFDANSDGCDDDIIYPRVLVETSDGTNTLATFTNTTNGNYKLFPVQGDFTTQIVNLPVYYSSNPLNQLSQFTGLGESDNIDFCVLPAQAINDLSISVYPPIDDPRPGFDTSYQIVYSNFGTTQLSGNLTFQYDGSKIQFLDASETPSSQSTGLINFNYSNLNPFETRTIELDFNVFPPPTTNIDEILTSTATINPISLDETQEDNIFTLEQLVIGSYDPNDIRVLEGEEVLIEDIDNYLHYIIRFQNTGTASAINVRVEHILDDNLDWNTMHLQSLSHEGRVEISNGNDIQFIFDDINLPDSTTDEPNSHGFITFKIKPKSNLTVGDEINAVADIYFDFNPPIITNTATTQFVNNLSDESFEMNEISIYPNPTINLLNIESQNKIEAITIFDINGKSLKSIDLKPNSSTNQQVEVEDLSFGIYFIEIQSINSKQILKFLKK